MMKSILSFFLITGVLYSAELSRDSNGIVSDSSTNLQWQDSIVTVGKPWSEAINYCEDLDLGGESDWRLPNRNELISLVDYSKYDPAIKESVFQNLESAHYWSSTRKPLDYKYSLYTKYAMSVKFTNGNSHYYNISYGYGVRCVRGRQ